MVTFQLAALVDLWSISVLVKAAGSGYKNQLAKCRITVLISKFFVLSFLNKRSMLVPSTTKPLLLRKLMGGKWMSKESGQWRVNSHWQEDGAWSLSPSWRTINLNERKENGCLYCLLGRELAPSPPPPFKNKAWNIIIFIIQNLTKMPHQWTLSDHSN